ELYETMTGGGNWTLRHASAKPILDPKAFPESRETGWRVRADTASRSYQLEHREVERWTSVASFLIAAGECRMKEQPSPEPAPPGASAENPR
ncbi:MAG: hypothetical protein ABFD86_16695, partial [Bryobacteraceae bacterium]